MEEIPKRQALVRAKAKKRETFEEHEEHTNAAEVPTQADGNMPASRSRGSSFGDRAKNDIRLHASSEEDVEDDVQADEEYHPAKTSRAKRVTPRYKIKLEVSRHQPYARRPSKNQPKQASPGAGRAGLSPNTSVSPQFTSSRMMEHSPVYTDHQPVLSADMTDHMMSSIYSTHHDMNTFYTSSMGYAYHGLPAPHPPPCHDTHARDFHFQLMHDLLLLLRRIRF